MTSKYEFHIKNSCQKCRHLNIVPRWLIVLHIYYRSYVWRAPVPKARPLSLKPSSTFENGNLFIELWKPSQMLTSCVVGFRKAGELSHAPAGIVVCSRSRCTGVDEWLCSISSVPLDGVLCCSNVSLDGALCCSLLTACDRKCELIKLHFHLNINFHLYISVFLHTYFNMFLPLYYI